MPIYEYRRPDGTTFEIQQSFSDDPLTVDPDTGVPVERVLHPPALHFKGKGFYSTDYGSRKRERETVAAAEGSADSSSNGARAEKASQGQEGSGERAASSQTPAKKSDGAGKTAAKT
jgi:predicted nucleic acid-binding Zn ribbon protein